MSDNKNKLGVIIDNARDRKAYHYLVKCKGEQMVEWAVNNLNGNRKPYVSNVAKKLMVEIPPENELADPDKIIPVDKGLEMLRQVVRFKRKVKK